MMELNCKEIAQVTEGTIISGNPDTVIEGVSIDTRTINPGQWFVPLRGEKTDGHYFIADAFKKGAAGAFYDYPFPPDNLPGVIIKVNDTLKALQKLAEYYRQKFSPVVIGVTGSSGKTTTKDLIAQLLGKHFQVLKTEGNYNNHIGLPLTLLNLTHKDQVVILEMAMRGPGEIAQLAQISRPQWGIITNIGEAHVELLGSRENIALAKKELLDVIGKEGKALLNGDDQFLREIGREFIGEVHFFGWGDGVDFQARDYRLDEDGVFFIAGFPGGEKKEFFLPLPGKHNVNNAMVALALGYMMGIDVTEMNFDAQSINISEGRMEIKTSPSGIKIIDDTYNANPSSMQASLNVLKELKQEGRKIAILGEMLELGSYAEEAHRGIGKNIKKNEIDCLITIGEMASYIGKEANGKLEKLYHCENKLEAWEYLNQLAPGKGDCILIKGSRGLKLEEIVMKLME